MAGLRLNNRPILTRALSGSSRASTHRARPIEGGCARVTTKPTGYMGFDRPKPFTLTLGDVLHAAGIEPDDALVIRHTYKPDGLASPADATPEAVLAYTRVQHLRPGKIPAVRPVGG